MSSDYVASVVRATDYSVVSGAIPTRCAQLLLELQQQAVESAQCCATSNDGCAPTSPNSLKKREFCSLVCCNIGCPQSMGQPYITFPRLVMSLVDAPCLLDHPEVGRLYPEDVIARAKKYLGAIGPKTGAYTPAHGYPFVRQIVAQFINERDAALARADGHNPTLLGEPTTWQDVVMTDGASVGIRQAMQLISAGPEDAICCPVPAYPLYTAMLTLVRATPIFYELEESKKGWQLTSRSIAAAIAKCPPTATPRLLILPNPGNPTGQVLLRDEMEAIIRLAHQHKMILLADEVYQQNIYQPNSKPFLSFRYVLLTMPEPFRSETMMLSLHSASKGLIAECGRRGGFTAFTNIPPTVRVEFLKLNSINICPNVNGQLMTALMVDPPLPTDPSFAQYDKEMTANFTALQQRATYVAEQLDLIRGISCQPTEGAMYLFPSVTMPAWYIAANEQKNKERQEAHTVDTRWALELMEQTGVVVIPGDGFLQQDGTYHFRTTILPSCAQLTRMIQSIKEFHESLMDRVE